jgi:hypothetical protein
MPKSAPSTVKTSVMVSSTTTHSNCTNRPVSTSATTLQIATVSNTLTPGVNGVPACAYILAADLGPDADCPYDHCDCGGTIAPLTSSQISMTGTRIWTTNCDYKLQPVTSSCPAVWTIGGPVLHGPATTLVSTETTTVGGVVTVTAT